MDSITCCNTFSSGIYFEIKKSIVGFRLKVVIESDLDEQNFCIFVEVKKTPTVGELFLDMLERFNLKDYGNVIVKFFVEESEVLSEESILVLADVRKFSVRMISKPISSTSALNIFSDNSRDSSNAVRLSSNHRSNPSAISTSHNLSTTSTSHHQHDDRPSRRELKHSKSKKENAYSQNGVARLLKHLKEENEVTTAYDDEKPASQQTFDEFNERLKEKNVDENSISQHEDTHHQNEEKERKISSDHSRSGIASSQIYPKFEDVVAENQTSNELNESFLEKGKRKRKRKHSKKKEQNVKADMNASNMTLTSVSHPPAQSVSRKHTFFEDFEEIEDVDGTADQIRSKILRYVDESIPNDRTSSSFYNGRMSDAPSKVDSDDVKTTNNAESPITNSAATDRLEESPVESSRSVMDHPFSVPASRQNAETDQQLGTLLMLKELKTCGQYKVQFLNQDKIDTRRRSVYDSETGAASISSSTSISPSPSKRFRVTKGKSGVSEVNDARIKNENASENHTSTNHFLAFNNDNSSKECEMVLQFKVVNDKIFLRKSDAEWKQLTLEVAVKDLTPVKKPVTGQSIVFQLLYLKNNLYPTISGLILGHVLNYDSTRGKIVTEIQSSLLGEILSCREGDEPSLPEGMTAITDQVYELDWIAVKDPRELE